MESNFTESAAYEASVVLLIIRPYICTSSKQLNEHFQYIEDEIEGKGGIDSLDPDASELYEEALSGIFNEIILRN